MGKLVLLAAMVAAVNAQPALVRNGVRPLSQVSAVAPAPGDVDVLVRQALEDRLAVGDLPDGGLLRTSTRVAILEELPKAKMKLGPAALPKREGYEFYFTSAASAQAIADSTGRPVHFLLLDLPIITGETATIRMGTDVVFPQQPKVLKLCCCSGQGQFRRTADRWVFVKWADMICS